MSSAIKIFILVLPLLFPHNVMSAAAAASSSSSSSGAGGSPASDDEIMTRDFARVRYVSHPLELISGEDKSFFTPPCTPPVTEESADARGGAEAGEC